MTQKRAKKGGEIAINGEFYKGGAFIATTEKSKQAKNKKGTGRMQISYNEWECPPNEYVRPVWGRISNFIDHAESRKTGFIKIHAMFNDDHPAIKNYSNGMNEIEILVEKYNKGIRWI